jgi:hypothetical protein
VAEPNDDSILETTKKLVGIEPDNTDFDTEIVTHINSVFFTLQQLGVGPKLGFMIMGSEETWSQFILLEQIMAVKSYMGLKVKLLFDPPVTGPATAAMESLATQMEWRLKTYMEGVQWDEASNSSSLNMEMT